MCKNFVYPDCIMHPARINARWMKLSFAIAHLNSIQNIQEFFAQ
jgi:hypothetical protein